MDAVVHAEAGVLAGGLDGSDEVASVAFPPQFLGEGFIENEVGAVSYFFDIDFVGDDAFVEFREFGAGLGERGEGLADFDLGFGFGLLHAEGEGVGDDGAGAGHLVEDCGVGGERCWPRLEMDGNGGGFRR